MPVMRFLLLLSLILASRLAAMDLYVSGYGPSIHTFTLNDVGELTLRATSVGGKHPSFLALHPTKPWVYAVNEGDGSLRAFHAEDDGTLRLLNTAASGGKGPCHCAVSPDGRWLLAANYGSGHVALLPIADDGSLGAAATVLLAGKHAHMAITDPSGTHVYVPCKGSDHIAQYALSDDTLVPLDPAEVAVDAGAGPRHLVFSNDGQRAYLVNELANTVTALSRDGASGQLHVLASAPTLPEDFTGTSTAAHIVLNAAETVIYTSNRGHNSLARFTIVDGSTLTLRDFSGQDQGLATPRHFALSPDGHFLIAAAQKGDELLTYAVATDGALSLVGRTPCAGNPCCVVFTR